MRTPLWAGLLLTLSCSGGTQRTFANEGTLCILPDSATAAMMFREIDYEADRTWQVSVQFPTCLSSSCSSEIVEECSVQMEPDGALRVTSNGSYLDQTGSCTDDCGFLIARCTTPVLASGTHRFLHGTDELTLTVPTTSQPACTATP